MDRKRMLREMLEIALVTALLCILSPIALPIGPVPITLGVFAAYLAAFILGSKKAMMSYALYLLLGMAGLPVFSGYAGGIAKLLGPTGGYLLGMLFMTGITGFFVEHYAGKKNSMLLLGMLLSAVVNYIFGTTWLALQVNLTLAQALMAGVVPFLPADGVKLCLAFLVGLPLRKQLRRVKQKNV